MSSYLFVSYSSILYSVFNDHISLDLLPCTILALGDVVNTRFVDLGCRHCRLVGSNSSHSPTYRVLYAVHRALGLIPMTCVILVGSSGLEPPTSRLSGARSNHLSYEPMLVFGVSRSLEPFAFPTSSILYHRALHYGLQMCNVVLGRRHCRLVEMMGIEPMTPCLQGRCSPS